MTTATDRNALGLGLGIGIGLGVRGCPVALQQIRTRVKQYEASFSATVTSCNRLPASVVTLTAYSLDAKTSTGRRRRIGLGVS